MADARGGRMRITDLKNGKEIFEGFIVDNITIKDIKFDEEKFNNLIVDELTREDLFNIILAYRKQLKRKEQECEELTSKCSQLEESFKETADGLLKIQYALADHCNKYSKTLAEIKPILEFYANSKMGEEQPDRTYKIMLSGGYIMAYDPKPAREALRKINEVENES
jgi:hypothetical protein